MPLRPTTRPPARLCRTQARWILAGAALLLLAGCRGKSPEEDREALYRSSTALKRDSAATAAFFRTVLGDSVQRERLAGVILEHEGMRRTMTHALIRDSLARVPGATDRTAPPDTVGRADRGGGRSDLTGGADLPDSFPAVREGVPSEARRSDFPLREDAMGRHPATGPRQPSPSGPP